MSLAHELRRLRVATAAYTASLGGYGLLIALVYPAVRSNREALERVVAAMPRGMLAAFAVTDVSSPAGHLGGQLFNLLWPLLVGVFAVSSGGASVAREVELGTIELWLTAPHTRARLLLTRFGALLLALTAVSVLSLALTASGMALVGERFSLGAWLAAGAELLLLSYAMAGVATLCSSVSSTRAAASGAASAAWLLAWLFSVLAGLSERLRPLRWCTPFTAFSPQTALATGRVDVAHLAVLGALAALSVAGAAAAFERRDAVAT